jgi:hypothetical protein
MNYDENQDDLDELPEPPGQGLTKTERALLEWAATAIGAIRFEEVDGESWANLRFDDGSVIYHWNPLVHDDDAHDVAARLKLSIAVQGDEVIVTVGTGAHVVTQTGAKDDLESSTRRAITGAAAEIGKQHS